MPGSYVRGAVFSASGKIGTANKTSATSLASKLTRVPASSLEEEASIEIGMSADGEFEVTFRVGKSGLARTLAKGNVARLALEQKRYAAREG